MQGEDSRSVPRRVADTDTYDGAVSQLVNLGAGEILLFYHSTPATHVSPEGRIVVRRSNDFGQTWSEPRSVIDESSIDPSSFSVVYGPAAKEITVLAVAYGFQGPAEADVFPEREYLDTYQVLSINHGQTWTPPEPVDALTLESAKPFGGFVVTKNGLMTAFQSDQHELEVLFSTDGGLSWKNSTFVAQSPTGHQLSEPVPCAVTEDKIMLYGRDNATGEFYAIKSSNGGRDWQAPEFFYATGRGPPNPIWIKRTGPNKLTAVWGDRTDCCIYHAQISADHAWENPTAFTDQPIKKLHHQVGEEDSASYWDGDAGDFGYPTFVPLSAKTADYLVVWYDESEQPNLWQYTVRLDHI